MKKKLFILALALFCGCASFSQTKVVWQGNKIFAVGAKESDKKPTKTPFTYTATDGTQYPIFIADSGSCFIIRTSKKSGKEYKMYLGKEVSAEICKKLGRTYKTK